MENTIQSNLFCPEQLGNKLETFRSSAALQKVLSLDIISLLRALAKIFNDNATACYDQIIPSFSQLYCQRLGLP